MIGLKRGTVELFPHNTAWEEEAKNTVKALSDILGGSAADIQHVGSTAIKSIAAKPIIDIAVAAYSFDDILSKKDELQKAGFYYRPQNDMPSQLLFACGSFYERTGDMQTHFIHVVLKDSAEWADYINFRDYLNATPDAAKEYEALKLSLAKENQKDSGREKYLKGKAPLVKFLLRKAQVFSYLNKEIHIGIDRPIGYVHRKGEKTLVYPINYGYIPGVLGGEGEELDVYLLGVDTPVTEADCHVIGIVHRRDDVEDKLIAAPIGKTYSKEEMAEAIRFQEKYYDTYIEAAER